MFVNNFFGSCLLLNCSLPKCSETLFANYLGGVRYQDLETVRFQVFWKLFVSKLIGNLFIVNCLETVPCKVFGKLPLADCFWTTFCKLFENSLSKNCLEIVCKLFGNCSFAKSLETFLLQTVWKPTNCNLFGTCSLQTAWKPISYILFWNYFFFFLQTSKTL